MIFIRKLLGLYKNNHEYWVNIDEIKLNPLFKLIGKEKYARKWRYFRETGELESKIILRRSDWMILDGYSSYIIAKKAELGKVPVYFVD